MSFNFEKLIENELKQDVKSVNLGENSHNIHINTGEGGI